MSAAAAPAGRDGAKPRSARQQGFRAREHPLRQRALALERDVVEIALLRGLDQEVVARAQLVDELELERAHAVPMFARRDLLDVDLWAVLPDLRLEQLVHFLELLAELL